MPEPAGGVAGKEVVAAKMLKRRCVEGGIGVSVSQDPSATVEVHHHGKDRMIAGRTKNAQLYFAFWSYRNGQVFSICGQHGALKHRLGCSLHVAGRLHRHIKNLRTALLFE